MGYLIPPLPEKDGSDIKIMLKRLKDQQLFLGFIIGAGVTTGVCCFLFIWASIDLWR